MNNMAVRVELNGPPPWSTYNELHEAMARIGLYKVIQSDAGVTHNLPKGLYVGDVIIGDVKSFREFITPIISAIWADADFIVFRFDQASWVLPRTS